MQRFCTKDFPLKKKKLFLCIKGSIVLIFSKSRYDFRE